MLLSDLSSGHAVAQHRQAGVAGHRHCKDAACLDDVPVRSDVTRVWLHNTETMVFDRVMLLTSAVHL